jgi:undecaprenyl-phosphate 4-deoxy-4-formamido-L-arabinose transferase
MNDVTTARKSPPAMNTTGSNSVQRTDSDSLAPGVSVVIPVFNSERILPALATQLHALFQERGERYEVIFVNDCSCDNSWQVIAELAARDPHVRGFDLMRNYHQHNALLCGIRAARYDVVVTMDDDLQHPPAEIPNLLAKLTEGFDVVYGAPQELPHGLLRNLASTITKVALQSGMGAQTARRVSAFRAFRTQLRQAFQTFSGSYVSIDVLLTWGTTRFTHILVRHEPRLIGQSNYTVGKLLTHAVNMMTGFSTLPLQVASLLGFVIMAFGVFILGFVLVRYVIHDAAPQGFPFLASIIAIFSGTQLFALGVIGEYLARMHFRLMDRPSYAVRQQRP